MRGRRLRPRKLVSILAVSLCIVALVYLALGLAFHVGWKSALESCRDIRAAEGEMVEPEVFGGVLGLAFDVTCWPVYLQANLRLDGTPFATPCTH